jgi:hypothetical protein
MLSWFIQKQARLLVNLMFGKGYNQDKIGFLYRLKTFNYKPHKIFRHYAIRFRNRLVGKDSHAFWAKQKNYILFQKFMPGNESDTRVQITGNRAYAFLRYNRKERFPRIRQQSMEHRSCKN